MAQTFKFTGAGEGIPGLPHEVTLEEAQASGLERELQAAIASGAYQENHPKPARVERAAPGVGREESD